MLRGATSKQTKKKNRSQFLCLDVTTEYKTFFIATKLELNKNASFVGCLFFDSCAKYAGFELAKFL